MTNKRKRQRVRNSQRKYARLCKEREDMEKLKEFEERGRAYFEEVKEAFENMKKASFKLAMVSSLLSNDFFHVLAMEDLS